MESLIWPVLDKQGNKIGEAKRITTELLDGLPESMFEQIAASRNEHKYAFFSYRLEGAVSTPESTKKWLYGVAGRPDIYMFMLYAGDALAPVAHYGLFSMVIPYPEFGALLRFGRGGDKGFIHFCEISLLAFAFRNPMKAAVTLEIFADNYNVIRMHERSGFFLEKVWPLKAEINSVKDVVLTMTITRERFFEVNPWAMIYYE